MFVGSYFVRVAIDNVELISSGKSQRSTTRTLQLPRHHVSDVNSQIYMFHSM